MLSTPVKPRPSLCNASLKSTARSAPTPRILLASWTSSLSRRQVRTSDLSTTPRVVSQFTALPLKRRNTSWQRSRGFNWAKVESHSWLRMMHERKFVALFQSLDHVLVAFLGEALTQSHTAAFATRTPLSK